VIIDLRDNSGGSLEEASCFLGIFLKPNEKTYEVHYLDNEKPPESFYAKGPQLYDGPLGVLINAGTASAAELVAGSLRISQGAVLMGQRTFGKGSFQEGEIWKSHKKIAAFRTQGFYYLSDKTSPQLVGISPQIELPTIPELVLGVSNIENFREEDSYYHPLKAPIIKAPAAELSQNETIQGFDLCLKKGSPTLATASVEKINSEEQDMAFLVRYLDCNVQTLGAQNDSYRSF
jgi:carboxyl-terminal processing protease